jgi:hypothetical protein
MKVQEVTCTFFLIECVVKLLRKVEKNSRPEHLPGAISLSAKSGRHSERRLDVGMGGKVCNRRLRE